MKTLEANLKDSPLFNLSLTNKELFHSNFIAWLGEQYPNIFVELINKLLNGSYPNWCKGLLPDNLIIKREHKNFDISVFEKSDNSKINPRLVIENKVKSVPTKKQLNEYEDKINNDKSVALLLLTINEQLQELADIETSTRWVLANYNHLSTYLQQNISQIHNHYHKCLVDDYCTYVSNLQKVIHHYTQDELFFYKQEQITSLRELGIHDVCGKRKAQKVYSQLVNLFNEEKELKVVNKIDELKFGKNQIHIAWGYTNAPLIEVRFMPNKEEFVLIQIQGKQYRHAVEFFDTHIGNRISKDSKDVYGPSEKGIQFLKENYPHVLFGDNALSNYPDWEERKYGQRGKNKENAFCKYCNGKPSNYNRKYSCFVYQWIEIPNEMSVADLIKAIHDDVLNLMTLSTKN